MDSLVQLKNISLHYEKMPRPALSDISLDIARGEFIGVTGPNGSGKTTLLKIINGVLKPTGGSVDYNGSQLNAMHRREIARHIAVLPQSLSFLFPYTVMEIVLMGRSPYHSTMSLEGEEDISLAKECLERTGTVHLADRAVQTLSGGELQRIAFARALAQKPELLLLDEPTASQDLRYQIEVFELLRELHDRDGLTVVAISHDINLLAQYVTRLVMFRGGELVADGKPAEIITAERISNVYGIDAVIQTHPRTGSPVVFPIGPSHNN